MKLISFHNSEISGISLLLQLDKPISLITILLDIQEEIGENVVNIPNFDLILDTRKKLLSTYGKKTLHTKICKASDSGKINKICDVVFSFKP